MEAAVGVVLCAVFVQLQHLYPHKQCKASNAFTAADASMNAAAHACTVYTRIAFWIVRRQQDVERHVLATTPPLSKGYEAAEGHEAQWLRSLSLRLAPCVAAKRRTFRHHRGNQHCVCAHERQNIHFHTRACMRVRNAIGRDTSLFTACTSRAQTLHSVCS